MKKFIGYSLFYLLFIFTINFIYTDEYGNFYFLFSTFIGVLYNFLIIYSAGIHSKKHKFLNAGFIGVVTCFLFYNGGIIPLFYVKDFNFIKANELIAFLDNRMLIKFVSVTAVANVLYWTGYFSKVGDYIFAFYYKGFGYKKFLNLNINVLFPKILIVTGVLLSSILFSNGAFGRGVANAEDFSGPLRYLITFSSYIEKISVIGYFLLALIHFKTGKYKAWFWSVLIIQFFFAMIAGARGPILFLFLLTLIPFYYVYKKITITLVLAGIFSMVFAFTIAAELKGFTQDFKKDSTISVAEYTESFLNYREQSKDKLEFVIYRSVYFKMMERLNAVAPGSIAVKYKDEQGLDKSDPDFIKELSTIPLYTIVPRSKVFNTTFLSWGNWFRLKVLGYSDVYFSNTSFGQVAFYYFAGKWIAVIIGFFIYGVVMRFCNNILELDSGLSFLIFLAAISEIGHISASVPGLYVSFLRNVIFLPPLLYIIIRLFNKMRI